MVARARRPAKSKDTMGKDGNSQCRAERQRHENHRSVAGAWRLLIRYREEQHGAARRGLEGVPRYDQSSDRTRSANRYIGRKRTNAVDSCRTRLRGFVLDK